MRAPARRAGLMALAMASIVLASSAVLESDRLAFAPTHGPSDPSLVRGPGFGPTHRPALSQLAAPRPHAGATVTGVVRTVDGSPLAGVAVNLSASCPLPASPASCVNVNGTVSSADGSYTLGYQDTAIGYWLWTNRTPQYAGASAHLSANAGTLRQVNLTAPSYHALDTKDFVLPGWANLSAYAANANCDIHLSGCSSGSHVAGEQVPLLAWSQDGVFYVNVSNQLVFYSFANRSVESVAPWVPLYQNVMNYDGIENTEWITQDSQYVYTFGRPAPASTTVTAYWANVTTGRTWEYNFTGITTAKLTNNSQVQLLGEGGNYSIVAVVEQNGTVLAYNFWNQTQWILSKLAFFEANNIYWVPELDSFLDIEAAGAGGDRLFQYQLQGPEPGTTLVPIFGGKFARSYTSNGVNGVAFNVTSRTIAFTYLTTSPTYGSTIFEVLPNGTLGRQLANYTGGFPLDRNVGSPLPYSVISSEHRISVFGWGANYAGYTDLNFLNGSFTALPSAPPRWIGSNITYDHPAEYKLKIGGGSDWFPSEGLVENSAVEGMFYNTTYGLVESGIDCRTNGSLCSLNGNALGATVPGTVQYYWPTSGATYPYLPTVAKAELHAPAPVTNLSAITGTTTLGLTWTAPVDGTNPLLNYTVKWGPTLALGNSVNLPASGPPGTRISGLTPGTSYFVLVSASNLHGTSGGLEINATTRTTGPPAPSGLVSTNRTFYSVTLSWINPAGTLTDNHVYWAPSATCASPSGVDLGSVGTSFTVGGLSGATTYCFQVTASNVIGEGGRSGPLTVTTLPDPVPAAPSSLTSIQVGTHSIALRWDQPAGGGIVNDTVSFQPVCSGSVTNLSTGGPVTTFRLTGLEGGTAYCLTVTAWNMTGPSAPSSTLGVTTSSPPAAPFELLTTAVSSDSAVLSWSQSATDRIQNDTVHWGPACSFSSAHSLGSAQSGTSLVGLQPETTYCWTVQAWNDAGGSATPSGVSFTTLPLGQGLTGTGPTNLTVQSVTATEANLSWVVPLSGVVNAIVYIGSHCSETNPSVSVGGPFSTFSVTGLSPGTAYCFGVQLWTSSAGSLLSYVNGTTDSVSLRGTHATSTRPPGPLDFVPPLDLVVAGGAAVLVIGAYLGLRGTRRRPQR